MNREVVTIQTWRAMEDLVDCGCVKQIGLSNFGSRAIDALLRQCRIRPIVNQVQASIVARRDKHRVRLVVVRSRFIRRSSRSNSWISASRTGSS
jgi:diketogulonate reductase-like aldo/keto reductase